jgi:hypothetical protein
VTIFTENESYNITLKFGKRYAEHPVYILLTHTENAVYNSVIKNTHIAIFNLNESHNYVTKFSKP